MSLQTRLTDLVTAIATRIKQHRIWITGSSSGDLTGLATTAKGSIVAAINELAASGGSTINDATTSAGTTWSSQKINDTVTSAINGLATGAPAALNTLDELAAALGDDPNYAATITLALGNRLRVDTATQGLTTQQQGNARTNIGAMASADIGDPEADLVAAFQAALA